ncbi:intraflagellar transport protein 140 homolog [Watersipora subatra]|uniref:intraflagellar transport protein 140 homolog n=1 Tax=Watersipora subatra TaxID=2589382 RepID=UPI00355C392F
MAVYFDTKVDTVTTGIHTGLYFHEVHPLLVVTSYDQIQGGTVSLYNKDGEAQNHATIQRSVNCTAVCWQAQKKILAVGWESGELMIWNEGERDLHEAPKLHKAAISCLAWSVKGSRLVSTDQTGAVIVWKADARGRLQTSPLNNINLQESVNELIFRPSASQDPSTDLAALARAAVSGDESALDMFNWKKSIPGKPGNSPFGAPVEAFGFYVGTEGGSVYHCNETGKSQKCFTTDGSISKLMLMESKSILITITVSLTLAQHNISPSGDLKELFKVKLSGKTDRPSICWSNPGVLATATGEGVLRLWDLANNNNYVLTLENQPLYDKNEVLNCIAYCKERGTLAAGTNLGNVAMWKFSPNPESTEDDETCWKLQPPSSVDGLMEHISFGSSEHLVAVCSSNDVFILTEQSMKTHFTGNVAAVQLGPQTVSIDCFANNVHHEMKSSIQVRGVAVGTEAAAVWNGKLVEVYEINQDNQTLRGIGNWTCDTSQVAIHNQNVYTIDGQKAQVRTMQGTVKQFLNFTESEGVPITLDVCANYLVIGSSLGVIKVYDLSRRDAKAHNIPKNVGEIIPNFGGLVSVKCNCNGTKVSLIITQSDGKMDNKLYIWDTELDTVQFFDFETGRGEQDDDLGSFEEEEDISDIDRGRHQAAKDISSRYPISQFWDCSEPKLIVCEVKRISGTVATKGNTMQEAESLVVSLFSTPEHGTMIQDSFAMHRTHNSFLGFEVPYFYFAVKSDALADASAGGDNQLTPRPAVAPSPSPHVAKRTMRDFIGLEQASKSSTDAMMNFSFYLTIGNMDEAFKAIKLIKSESVWENMAKMCVKSRRLDVASVCLGNMGHARGAKALREANKYPELDARVAVLAIQLGLLDDAERLLKNCKRYDLLNELYQANGQWDKAIAIAESSDRIHLRSSLYNFAKHLEEKGDVNSAITYYERSGTQKFEVPRMLFDEPQDLEKYVLKSKDKSLRKWWAQYMESTGEMETSLQFYEAAQDYLSLVRVYCYCGNLDKAAEICNDIGDRAACYQLARTYENQDQIKESIHFYTRAQAYGNAIRLCREHEMDDQLMNLALLGTSEDMLEAAKYYEKKHGCQDKAVMLYHKAGSFSKALDLAFETKQFAALQVISESLTSNTDPEVLKRCAQFFLDNGQFDRAVDLLAVGRKYIDALKLCNEQNVMLTEDLVEKLTPEKSDDNETESERMKVLEAIATVCMNQRQYHLATKKYTQAGNRIKGMKALLKSGDTEKITFYAGVSRQKEIYVMAANYLQSLDWTKNPKVMKDIISFYTKGRALDSLASFYEACAQAEIDEYQNYEKALGALGEAAKSISNAKLSNTTLQEERLAALKHKIILIKKFVNAKRSYEDSPDEAVKVCQILLEEPEIDTSVRLGDLYGFMIEHYHKKGNYNMAYNLLQELRGKSSVNPSYFVSMSTLESIHKHLNIPLGRGSGPDKNTEFDENNDDEIQGEAIDEEVIDYD